MNVLLLSMPWAAIDTPSLALGILANRLRQTVPEARVETRYVNVDCAEWLARTITGAKRSHYDFFSLKSYFMGCGDWVFSSALYDDPQWRVEEFLEQPGRRVTDEEREMCLRLHAEADGFITAQARAIAAAGPDLVCFTSTFQQNVASLALARRLKELLPGVKTVMGGANCDGDQGKGIHRAFDCVDFVVRGEGEHAFPELVRCLMSDGDLGNVPGLCWRDGRTSVANAMTDRLISPAEIPMPDYDAYFDRIAATEVDSWFEPRLVIEAARGCWWGEKHHCTFCGLNGSAMTFRSKTPAAFTGELETLARRHHVLDFFAVDNILDMGYIETALKDIASTPYDYRIQYEIKSNMRFSQLERLREAGIVSVQPGIENLDSAVLKIMDKGVSGPQNIRMLRDAESVGLTVAWNYLYGFPGETEESYTSVISQMPALHHLYPAEGSSRIALERFSPYFDRPELGFGFRRPHAQYRMIYALPEEELRDIAYVFETKAQGIGPEVAEKLDEALALWGEQHDSSTLVFEDVGEAILLTDTRPGYDWHAVELRTPAETLLFRALDQPRTFTSLCSALGSAEPAGRPDVEATVRELLREWRELGLVFTNDNRYIHVATTAENQKWCRVSRRTGSEVAA